MNVNAIKAFIQYYLAACLCFTTILCQVEINYIVLSCKVKPEKKVSKTDRHSPTHVA